MDNDRIDKTEHMGECEDSRLVGRQWTYGEDISAHQEANFLKMLFNENGFFLKP